MTFADPTPPASQEPARATFEADVTAKGFPTHRRRGIGPYWMPEVEARWQGFQAGAAWQAARAHALPPGEGVEWLRTSTLDRIQETEANLRAEIAALRAARAYDTAADHVGDATEKVPVARPQEGAQAGWRLVPVEPTEAMLKAGNRADFENVYGEQPADCDIEGWQDLEDTGRVYAAMMAAAPAPQEGG